MSGVSGERGEGGKINIFYFIVPFFVEEGVKFLSLRSHHTFPLIPRIFYFSPPQVNPGIAFGLFQNSRSLSFFLALLATLFLLFAFRLSILKHPPLLLILAGAISNLSDRLLYGGVVDYLTLKGFPWTFNMADVFILTGSVWFILRGKHVSSTS